MQCKSKLLRRRRRLHSAVVRARAITGCTLLALCVACGDNKDASLRVVSGIALAIDTGAPPAFDLYIDDGDRPWIADLAYAQPSPAFALAAGTHRLRAQDAITDEVVAELDIPIGEDEDRVVLLEGFASAGYPTTFVPLDPKFEAAASGTARVRYAVTYGIDTQLAPIGTNVRFDVGRDGDDAQAPIGYATADITTPAGVGRELLVHVGPSYELGAFVMPALADGGAYYALVFGSFLVVDPAVQAYRLLVLPSAGDDVLVGEREPSVTIVNATLDTPGLQTRIDGEIADTALAYRGVFGPVHRRTGAVSVRTGVASAIDVTAFDDLAGDQLFVIAGTQGSLRVIAPGPATPRLRVIHAADAGPLDVSAGPTPLATNLTFGQTTPGAIPATEDPIVVRQSGSAVITIPQPRVGNASIILIGRDAEDAERPLEALLVR